MVPSTNFRPPTSGQHLPAGLPFQGTQGSYLQHGFQHPSTDPVPPGGNAPVHSMSQPPFSSLQPGFTQPPPRGNMPYTPPSLGSGPPPPGPPHQSHPPTHAVPPAMVPGAAPYTNPLISTGSMQMNLGSPMESSVLSPGLYGGQNQNVSSGAFGQVGAQYMQGNQAPPGLPPVYAGKGLPPSAATGPLQTQPQQPRRLDPDQMPSAVRN